MDDFAQFEDGGIYRAGDGRLWMFCTPFGRYCLRAFVQITNPDDENDIGVDPKTGAYTVVVGDDSGGWTLGIHPAVGETVVFAAMMDAADFEIVGHRQSWRSRRAPLVVTPAVLPAIGSPMGAEQVENDVEDAQLNADFRELMSDSDIQL